MSEAFIAYLQDLFAEFGPVTARRMFGGYGLYHEGVIVGVVMDDAVYLKADDGTRAQFEAAGGAPFVYTSNKGGGLKQPITMSYWSLPDEAMESPQAMLPWARLAWEAALRKPARRAGRDAAPRKPR